MKNREYNKDVDIEDEIYPISIWSEIIQSGMIGNYDGSGYWVKNSKTSRDEIFHTPCLDATHVVWYNK